jgi:hypothetical protein
MSAASFSELIPLIERAASLRRANDPKDPAALSSVIMLEEVPEYSNVHSALAAAVRMLGGRASQEKQETALHAMWRPFRAETIAHWLARRAVVVSPEQAAADLTRFLEAKEFPYKVSVAISGVFTDHDVQFSPTLWLRHDQMPKVFRPPGMVSSILHWPTAVLVEDRVQQVLTRPVDESDWLRSVQLDADDAVLCLSLVHLPAVPFIVGLECTPADWVPVDGFVHLPYSLEGTGHLTRLWPAQTDRAQEIFQRFKTLPSSFRTRLGTPMSRLNSAMRRRHEADTAIDLGIALESLFLGDSEGGEKKFQASTRCAFLLGSDPADRHRLFDLAGCIYHLRNRAVHRGQVVPGDLKGPFKGRPLRSVLEDGGRLMADALMHFIATGVEPAWEELLLGPHPPANGNLIAPVARPRRDERRHES